MLDDITYEPTGILEIPIGNLNAPIDIVFDGAITEVIYQPETITIFVS